ncbi:MAG: hypothetical protein WA667_28730 [Candidatus Nitrosopolaris sp.]
MISRGEANRNNRHLEVFHPMILNVSQRIVTGSDHLLTEDESDLSTIESVLRMLTRDSKITVRLGLR